MHSNCVKIKIAHQQRGRGWMAIMARIPEFQRKFKFTLTPKFLPATMARSSWKRGAGDITRNLMRSRSEFLFASGCLARGPEKQVG
jgi:hypothetical protein